MDWSWKQSQNADILPNCHLIAIPGIKKLPKIAPTLNMTGIPKVRSLRSTGLVNKSQFVNKL